MPLSAEGEKALPRLAMKWSRMVADRNRWDGTERGRLKVEAEAVADLEMLLGKSAAKLVEEWAGESVLEVSIRWGKNEDESWPARIMPWESLVTAATRQVRNGAKLVVVRHLDCGNTRKRTPKKPVTMKGLVVCSTPSLIGPTMKRGLIEEARVVDSLWTKHQIAVTTLHDPSAKVLEDSLKKGADWVHFLGANGRDVAQRGSDSLVLAGRDVADMEVMTAAQICRHIGTSRQKPGMVVFNFCSTAGRLAPSAVAGGAEAAIGFQDLVTDQPCMDVAATFYPALKRRGGDLLGAFLDLWGEIKGSLDGSVIVLWSARSLVVAPVSSPTTAMASKPVPEPDQPAAVHYEIPDTLDVQMKPVDAVNFSLLHNRCSLFRELVIGKGDDPPMRDVLIEITVNDGGQNSTWRELRVFPRGGQCIAKDVQVSFISAMVRSLSESLFTSLQVTISHNGRLLFSKSERILLLSIDEWVDDNENRCWLPSFVHPRDAAVAGIITRAEGYLQALCDDFGAGFNGYQAVPEMVTLQVRALWVAISRDCDIRYINPPPTYTKASQRLRRPAEILATRQGTCLDLALLLGACLEWIGVYPVIILISGHAFPGYWRSEEDYLAFYNPTDPTAPTPTLEQRRQSTGDPGLQRRWITGKTEAAAVLREVQAGRLVPLETVWLTNGRSFSDALRAGRHNLYAPGAFEYLIDIQRAREHGITPLPLPEKS